MQKRIKIASNKHNVLYDITSKVKKLTSESKIVNEITNVYVQGTTAGIMIQENWDESVQNEVVILKRLSNILI